MALPISLAAFLFPTLESSTINSSVLSIVCVISASSLKSKPTVNVVLPAWLAVNVAEPSSPAVVAMVNVPLPIEELKAYLPSKSTVGFVWFDTVPVRTPVPVLKDNAVRKSFAVVLPSGSSCQVEPS